MPREHDGTWVIIDVAGYGNAMFSDFNVLRLTGLPRMTGATSVHATIATKRRKH